jgi:hypothetical protein
MEGMEAPERPSVQRGQHLQPLTTNELKRARKAGATETEVPLTLLYSLSR